MAVLGWRCRSELVCKLRPVLDTLDSAHVDDMIAEEVDHDEKLFLNLLCIFELEHLLLELELHRALGQVLPRLAFLHILKLVEVPAQSTVELGVDFSLLNRVSQVAIRELLRILFFKRASSRIFAQKADLDNFDLFG